MEHRWVKGGIVFYTNWFIPKKFSGMTYGFIAFIRPHLFDDVGLLAHESTHIKQWWRSFGLGPFLYLLSKNYRLKWEVEAYRAQLAVLPETLRWGAAQKFASSLSTKYRLGIPFEAAFALIYGREN